MSNFIISNFNPFIFSKGGGEIPNGILSHHKPDNRGGIMFVI